jgi:DNA polymerase
MKTEDLSPTSTSAEFLKVVTALKRHLLYLREMGITILPSSLAQPSADPLSADRQGRGRGRARINEVLQQPVSQAEALHHRQMALQEIRNRIGDCHRCKLHTNRTHLVFGTGNPMADLVFVGEAPGEDEDLQGEPFVGKAGQLLNKMIQAMGLKREQVYIANIVKCRPPNNRNPEPDEIASCEPFLIEQLGVIKPSVICALGNFAAQTLLRTRVKISQLRGKFNDYQGIKVMPTFHPAYLLRNPQDKRLVWEDLQKVMAELKKIQQLARTGSSA